MMNLKVKRLTETAKLPTRAHPTDAGLDLYCDEDVILDTMETRKVKLGVSVELPRNHALLILPKSGLSTQGLVVLAPVVDEGYTGEIHAVLLNCSPKLLAFQAGSKVAQGVLVPVVYSDVEEVTEITGNTRGANGFGSTGNK